MPGGKSQDNYGGSKVKSCTPWVSEIQPGQHTFSHHPHTHETTWVKTVPLQPLAAVVKIITEFCLAYFMHI